MGVTLVGRLRFRVVIRGLTPFTSTRSVVTTVYLFNF